MVRIWPFGLYKCKKQRVKAIVPVNILLRLLWSITIKILIPFSIPCTNPISSYSMETVKVGQDLVLVPLLWSVNQLLRVQPGLAIQLMHDRYLYPFLYLSLCLYHTASVSLSLFLHLDYSYTAYAWQVSLSLLCHSLSITHPSVSLSPYLKQYSLCRTGPVYLSLIASYLVWFSFPH